MDSALRRLCIEVLKDNVQSQVFNELLLETGVSLDSWEWEIPNKMLGKGDEILRFMGGHSPTLH